MIDGRRWKLVALALLVGAGAGAGAVAFRYLIQGFSWFFSGHANPGAHPSVSTPWLPSLGWVCILIVPVVGGALYGPLVARFAPEARGHGVPEVMLAVARRGGQIRTQVPVVKSLASAICIGSGGSVGREGPIVQIGSALGSLVGQVARLPEPRVRLLVACGAAGGIAATFNAPIAGVFFALEIILRDFETNSFGLVVLSSVTAAAIGRVAFGSAAFLHLPQFELKSADEFLLYAGLGIVAAGVGVLFTRFLYASEDTADRLWRGPEWLRPAAGGLLLGGVLLALPQMYGVGYPVLEGAVRGHYAIAFLLLLLVGKVVATSLTISIGGSGGVFAPSLFMGSMLGSAYGQGLHAVLPGTVSAPGAYALVGMGAVFGAAARAPITAVIIIFELTGDYGIILPLMVAVVIATGIAGVLTRDTIYTLKLRRRGIDLSVREPESPMERARVSDAMRPAPRPLPSGVESGDALEAFAQTDEPVLPVVDASGGMTGVLSLADAEAAAAAADGDGAAAAIREVRCLHPDDSLATAAYRLADSEQPGLPVCIPGSDAVVGWITHRDVLRAYREASGDARPE